MSGPPPEITPLPRALVADPAESPFSAFSEKVSVVIPVKNAAAYVAPLVQKLRMQRGVLPCEIIFVDSGSTDDTATLARNEGAAVIEISATDFTHAFSRNKGAGMATGDLLLFMVQDALPLTDLWLWEMMTALKTNQLAAISCAEFPRSDCDLFYRFVIHTHYDSSGANEDRILTWNDACSSYAGLRASAQLSDIAALIRRNVFETYRYQTAYAEDLDLGIRLIRDGHKLGFLHNTRVLHSHNRTAFYFLKRGYVDARFLPEVFSNFTFPEMEDESKLFHDILAVGRRIRHAAGAVRKLAFPVQVQDLTQSLEDAFKTSSGELISTEMPLGSELERFMQALAERYGKLDRERAFSSNAIRPHVLDHCRRLHEWLGSIYDAADATFAQDLAQAWEKVFAIHSGTHIAYLYLTLKRRARLPEHLVTLDGEMTVGV